MKQIIDETYQEDNSSSNSPISLVHYFEKRLNEVDHLSLKSYLDDENILSLPLTFSERSKCYRMVMGQTEIDFPSNWSIFSKFQSDRLVYVHAAQDSDYLCEIFLSYVGEVNTLVLANDNDGLRLIFLRDEKAEKQLVWLVDYFAKKIETEEKKAA